MTDVPIDPLPWPKAAAVIREHGWTQGTINDDEGRLCLLGGLRECGLAPGEWLFACAVAQHRGHGEEWNDADGRTEAEVVGWLASADPITPGELAEVLGPQWREVCALVKRLAVMTDDEARRVDAANAAAWAAAQDAAQVAAWAAAQDAARDAAWDAARDAALAAARDAALAAAWDAAWDAAWAAAWDAAWDAAWASARAVRALVVRDLIAADGPWDQAAYDTLTGPLRKAGITVHPDDPPMEATR